MLLHLYCISVENGGTVGSINILCRRKRALIGRILAEEYEDGDQDQEVQDPAREVKQEGR